MINFLSIEEVVSAHYFMMKRMNDAAQAGVKDYALLASAVHRPQQSPFGEDAYPSLFDKGAVLLESLVKNHCFHNGNKRTAYLVTKSFLLVNGWHLRIERMHAVEFVVDIAKGIYSLNAISEFLKEHSEKKS
ncbi:Toxin Doc [compost metagenome]